MPPSPAPRPRTRASARMLRLALALAIGRLAAVAAPAAEGDPSAYLDPSPERTRKRMFLASGGLEFPISGSQGLQPRLAAYLDLPRSLQAGLMARVDLRSATEPYDYIPQVALQLRQIWLNDQDTSTVRNSEYFSLNLGAYPAYDFKGERSGARPMFGIAFGKYWMPFENRPYGLDFGLEITRFFDGHPPGRPRTFFLSVGVVLFRAISLRAK